MRSLETKECRETGLAVCSRPTYGNLKDFESAITLSFTENKKCKFKHNNLFSHPKLNLLNNNNNHNDNDNNKDKDIDYDND